MIMYIYYTQHILVQSDKQFSIAITEVIVPGLIDTTTARVEDPRLIAESLLRYARAAGHPARVIASTDCGFASTARSTAITADLATWQEESLNLHDSHDMLSTQLGMALDTGLANTE